MKMKSIKERVYFQVFRLATFSVVLFLVSMIWTFIANGAGTISWTFITDIPRKGMTEGGIYPAIIGTVLLTVGSLILAFPVGVASAIYLVEYARESRFMRVVNSAIMNLASVPSVVHGLFGFGLFVSLLGFSTSILSGILTLFLLILPIVISASREALLAVPNTFREGSLALGATKLETVVRNIIPYSFPGMITGSVLAVARAAGETAPIVLTATFFFSPSTPTSLLDGTMALSTHIYYMATQHPNPILGRPITYGTVLVLLGLVLSLNLLAIVVRTWYRRRKDW